MDLKNKEKKYIIETREVTEMFVDLCNSTDKSDTGVCV